MKRLHSNFYILIFFSIGCSLLSANAWAQSSKEKAEDLFNKMYPKAENVDWNIDDHDNFEAEFKINGEKYRADFDTTGKWIETENNIKWKELPDIIQKEVEKDYDKDEIAEIERVDHHSKGLFYDVEIKDKGKNIDLEFDKNGKRLN